MKNKLFLNSLNLQYVGNNAGAQYGKVEHKQINLHIPVNIYNL